MNRSWNRLTEKVRFWWSSPLEEDRNPNDVIPHFSDVSIRDHYFGKFSMAVLKGSNQIEDRSQVVVKRGRVFCGVYDGHGGNRASSYLVDNLYKRFSELSRRTVTAYMLRRAIVDTENGFLRTVQREFVTDDNRRIAANGSSCLIGVLFGGKLYYANLGDSRAVLASVNNLGNIVAVQLTQDHNVNVKEVRREYKASHQGNDPLLVKVNGMWHIKGIIQVTRSIGDECFKLEDLALDSTHRDFHIRGCTRWPLLSSDPSVESMDLKPYHRFVIFATRGLWEHLTIHEAAEVVYRGPKRFSARRLVKRAIRTKAIKAGMSYERLKAVSIVERRKYLDDISVIVLFINHEWLETPAHLPQYSARVFFDEAGPSNLNNGGRS